MVAAPDDTPNTTPVPLTLAIVLLLELHVPPPAASLRVMLLPWQKDPAPVIVPADGAPVTVIE